MENPGACDSARRHAGIVRWLVASLTIGMLLAACGGGAQAPAPQSLPAPASNSAPSPAPVLAMCPIGIDMGDIQPTTPAAADCAASQFDLHSDIAYGAASANLLDLLLPRNAPAAVPLIVWVHGGGWQSGDKGDRLQAQRLVCRGYALASLDYRLSDTAIFPAQVHDVKAAIRYLRANAALYGIDASRIALFGSSAGGHLAALAGVSAGINELEDSTQGNAGVSSAVQAVVDWYGPSRLAEMDAQLVAEGCPAASVSHGRADSPESRLLGCTLSDASCASQARLADPSQHVDGRDPPMLLLHGTADCVSPQGQSELLANSANDSGVCAVRRRVLGAGHGGAQWLSPEVQDATAQFLDRALENPAGPATPVVVACSAFLVTGDASANAGARWTYHSIDAGIEYTMSGVLFRPSGAGPFPAAVVSHGFGGSAAGYSANVARTMAGWGMAAIATNYTHAPDTVDADLLPQGGDGASAANVQRAHKARDLLSCVAGVDMNRLAVHGHSMGAFVTAQVLGTYPNDFRAASHSAGGANDNGPNATRAAVAANIRTPYQLHHGDADMTVNIGLDQTLQRILAEHGVTHEFITYPGFSHEQMALDADMFARVRAWYQAHRVIE